MASNILTTDSLYLTFLFLLSVVTYGMTASAYNAVRALIQCATDHELEHPRAAKVVENNFYMDDMLASCDSIDEADTLKSDAIALLAKGGFELDKWVSNGSNLMQAPVDTETTIPNAAAEASVLGIKWDYTTDELTIKVQLQPQKQHMTKRDLASQSASFYDPLLVMMPVMIRAKQFLKETWRLKIGWDQWIPTVLRDQWVTFYESLTALSQLRIPRWIGISKGARIQLHVFTDASEQAYGAVAYAVTISGDQVQSGILMSKSRLSPTEKLSKINIA